jgi:hypothetical protein
MIPIPAGLPQPGGPLMNPIFGQNGQPVLALIVGIADLSAEDVDQVTDAWKQVRPFDRAAAWARLVQTTTEQERYQILAAASLARREALAAAHRLRRLDWAFWAAASDAAAAVAAGARLGRHYDTLTAPLVAVMPALVPSPDRTHGGAGDFAADEPRAGFFKKGA